MKDNDAPTSLRSEFLNRSPLTEEAITSGNYWAELRVFLAVAKTKSFNKAAVTLSMSPATVSRHVYRLQDALKIELFSTGHAGVQLTPPGVDLAVMLTRLDFLLGDISKNIHSSASDPEGDVSIAITEGLATGMLTLPIAQFADAYPLCTVSFKNPRSLTDIRDNACDIFVGLTPDTGSDVVCSPLGTLHLVPIVSTFYLERFGEPKLEALASHRFVHADIYSSNNPFWREWHALASRGQRSHQCENSITYAAFVKAGYGIGLLSSFVTIDPTFKPADLNLDVQIPLYAIAQQTSLNRGAAKVAYDWICDVFSSENPWFTPQLSFGNADAEASATFKFIFNL